LISLTTKYAIRALEALKKETKYISIQELAKNCDVAAPYLAKIMKILVTKGIIESKKGLNGGVRMRSNGVVIALYDVAISLNDPLVMHSCFLSKKQCNLSHTCAFHSSWSEIREEILKFLKNTVIWDPSQKK
jgi:Rrf2 family protein